MKSSGWQQFVPPDKLQAFQSVLKQRKDKHEKMAANFPVLRVQIYVNELCELDKLSKDISFAGTSSENSVIMIVHNVNELGWGFEIPLGSISVTHEVGSDIVTVISVEKQTRVEINVSSAEQAFTLWTHLNAIEVKIF